MIYRKLFFIFFLCLTLAGVAFFPVKSSAVPGPSLEVQIRKLKLQIKKLTIALADLQKAQALRITQMSKTSQTPLTNAIKPAIDLKIDTIAPVVGSYGTPITLKGSGFSATGNKVATTFGDFDNLSSSDEQTLSFTMNLFSDVFSQIRAKPQDWQKSGAMPVWLWVENEKGKSNQVLFNLNFKP